jgi:hypothetical protein
VASKPKKTSTESLAGQILLNAAARPRQPRGTSIRVHPASLPLLPAVALMRSSNPSRFCSPVYVAGPLLEKKDETSRSGAEAAPGPVDVV